MNLFPTPFTSEPSPIPHPTQVLQSRSIIESKAFTGDPRHPLLRCDQHQWVRSVGMMHCKCTCSGLDKCEWAGWMSNGGLTYGHVWRILAWHGNQRCHSLSVMRHHQQACLRYLGTYLQQLGRTAEENKQPKVSFVACDIVGKHGLQYLGTYHCSDDNEEWTKR